MLEAVFGIHISVVVGKILMPGVVRGIYIDYVDFSGVSVCKGGEGFEVVSLD